MAVPAGGDRGPAAHDPEPSLVRVVLDLRLRPAQIPTELAEDGGASDELVGPNLDLLGADGVDTPLAVGVDAQEAGPVQLGDVGRGHDGVVALPRPVLGSEYVV